MAKQINKPTRLALSDGKVVTVAPLDNGGIRVRFPKARYSVTHVLAGKAGHDTIVIVVPR